MKDNTSSETEQRGNFFFSGIVVTKNQMLLELPLELLRSQDGSTCISEFFNIRYHSVHTCKDRRTLLLFNNYNSRAVDEAHKGVVSITWLALYLMSDCVARFPRDSDWSS